MRNSSRRVGSSVCDGALPARQEGAQRNPMDATDSTTTRTTSLLDAAIEPPKARRLRLIVTVAVVTLGSSIQSGFATGVVRHTQLRPTPLRLV